MHAMNYNTMNPDNETIKQINNYIQTLRGWIQTNANNTGEVFEKVERMEDDIKKIKGWEILINNISSQSSGDGVSSLNALTGDVDIIAGSGITVTKVGNDVSIAATGGGGSLEIGEAITGGTPNQVLYTDSSGNLASDSGLLRIPSSRFAAVIDTATNSLNARFTADESSVNVGNSVVEGIGMAIYTNADAAASGAFGFDGVSVGATGLIGLFGHNDGVTGEQAILLTSSDGSFFGMSGPTAVLGVASATYEHSISLIPDGISIDAEGGIFLGPVGDKVTIESSTAGTSAEILRINDSALASKFSVNDSGLVTINGAYSFPTVDGSNGQALVTNGSGTLSFGSATPGLYFENVVIAPLSTATGTNSVAIGGGPFATINAVSGNYGIALGGVAASVSGTQSGTLAGNGLTTGASALNSAIAGGLNTSVTSSNAFAGGGSGNSVSGNTAVALGGVQLEALSFAEVVIGQYNTSYTPNSAIAWNAGDRAFTVGTGTGLGAEADGFTILKNGNVGIGIDNFEANDDGQVLQVNGSTRIDGRTLMSQGADVASAGTLTLGSDGNSFVITGTTSVDYITTTDWQDGSRVTLHFAGSVTLNDDTGTVPANTAAMRLSAATLNMTAGDNITFELITLGGSQYWRQVAMTNI